MAEDLGKRLLAETEETDFDEVSKIQTVGLPVQAYD